MSDMMRPTHATNAERLTTRTFAELPKENLTLMGT